MIEGKLPTHSFDGIELTPKRRLPAAEEKRNLELFLSNFAHRVERSRQIEKARPRDRHAPPVALSEILKGQGSVEEKVRQLVSANPRPSVRAKKVCLACKGYGLVRRDLPPNHPHFGKAQPCRKCRDPWTEYRRRIEAFWPVPPNTLKLGRKPIDERHPKLVILADLIEEIINGWPKGVIVVLDGRYGSVKTHALSILYDQAWKMRKGAAYLPSAQKLQEVFTLFQSKEVEVQASLTNAMQMEDGIAGHEIAQQQKRLRVDRRRLTGELLQVPWLLVDEAHRYSRKGGNGWVEQHMASLIDEKIARGTSVVLAGNGLGDGRIGQAGPIQNRLHPSILDRVTSLDCVWLDLNGIPSGRKYYARNAGTWWQPKTVKNG